MEGRDAPCQAEHKGDGMIRHFGCAVVGRVAYGNACGSGRLDVDTVIAGTGAHDDAAAHHTRDRGCIDDRAMPNHDAISRRQDSGVELDQAPIRLAQNIPAHGRAGRVTLYATAIGIDSVRREKMQCPSGCHHSLQPLNSTADVAGEIALSPQIRQLSAWTGM